ncbi:MAG TPA: CHAD domain-containing protein [Actinophytocola sp.]|uniref:CHAD domain-containing protein n=1 Tax=Actinophytocola sp. TaxID=1872138 RepID=UPI002DB8BA91|nr:CHAD domain-containing protein [Actinophytocola sp.]HEU5472103.1 CHAD domain-containing protein [Actinophytocola sp.]
MAPTATAASAEQPATPRPVDLGLDESPRRADPADPPAVHVRARLDEQIRALLEHEAIARTGTDPEGVHQMRVAVRRIRAALKAGGADLGEPAATLPDGLRWLGGVLGAVRDLDVQLEHLRGLAEDFPPNEREAAERLLLGLRAARRTARTALLAALREPRYRGLLTALAAAARSEPAPAGVPAPRDEPEPAMIDVVRKPYRRLSRAAAALGADPPDDDLHELRIHGKRLRYAAELAVPTAGQPIQAVIKATKRLQDILGDHQDACVAEQQIRRLLAELGPDPQAAFVAGRLVERERARRADCRARWRAAMAEVEATAHALLNA